MANLTVTIDDEVLRKARIRALELGSSVNRLVAEYLGAFAADEQHRTVESILELARQSKAGSGPSGRSWSRDELYDRR